MLGEKPCSVKLVIPSVKIFTILGYYHALILLHKVNMVKNRLTHAVDSQILECSEKKIILIKPLSLLLPKLQHVHKVSMCLLFMGKQQTSALCLDDS